jgi:Dolichyl-phosphate-mannose-protein mannosyltransferase
MKRKIMLSDTPMSLSTTEVAVAPQIPSSAIPATSRTTDLKRKRILKVFLRRETILVIVLLGIAAAAQAINMFHFPYFENDEGTYLSQAWAVVYQGRLAYYTYWYDHSPAGWFQIALWIILTGGFRTFGSPLYSGRILMLIMQLGSTFILYCIAKNISRSVLVATAVTLLFALSPYGIYYHRRVLLDNITTLTLLLSILLLVVKRLTLKHVWLSALAFSIAALSKEITAFVLPAVLCLVIYQVDKSHRWLAASGWIVLVFTIVSLYPLMAIINNELFPTGTFLGGNTPHVSLVQGVFFQASRRNDGGILNYNSEFWIMTRYWLHDDPVNVIFGTCAAIISVLVIKKNRLVGIMGLCSLCFWLYFLHGGEVIKFYLIPLLPLLALNLGLVLWIVAGSIRSLLSNRIKLAVKFKPVLQPALFLLCIAGIVGGLAWPSLELGYRSRDIGDSHSPFIYWTGTQADAQVQATDWVKQHVPLNSRIVIDMYMWPDLHEDGYNNAHYYWKVETDPAIRDTIFHNNWRNFDYIILSPQMSLDGKTQNMTLLATAEAHSTLFATSDTGGWPMKILKVNK